MQDILYTYSITQVRMLYEAAMRRDLRGQADFIEGVIAGVGASLGGKKAFQALTPLLKNLRGLE